MRHRLILSMVLLLFPAATLRAAETVPPSGSQLGAVTGGQFNRAHLVIEKRCTSCHTDEPIVRALSAGKDLQQIQLQMEKKGAQLSPEERSVLGHFWNETPLKKKKTERR